MFRVKFIYGTGHERDHFVTPGTTLGQALASAELRAALGYNSGVEGRIGSIPQADNTELRDGMVVHIHDKGSTKALASMDIIKATWKNGQLVPDLEVDWPEGCRLMVQPLRQEETLGLREEDWPETPEEKAAWLRWYESLEPLIMTPAEEAEWHAALKGQRDFDKSQFEARSKRIEGLSP